MAATSLLSSATSVMNETARSRSPIAVENIRSALQFTRDAVPWFRRRAARRDLFEAEPGARQLAVIGGGIAGSGLVLRAHLIELVGRLGGAAAPVGGARADNRIRGAFVDVAEMLQRAGRIAEKAQRDPAGHEVKFGTVIGIGGWCGLSHHPIGGLCIAEIDKPAGEQATFAPPFIGVLSRAHLGLPACVVH